MIYNIMCNSISIIEVFTMNLSDNKLFKLLINKSLFIPISALFIHWASQNLHRHITA